MSDSVNHPPHYTHGGIETIDFIEAKELNWSLANVVKYVSRAGRKGAELEDLRKAAWYLAREIKRLGGSDEVDDLKRQLEQSRELLDSRWYELQNAHEHRNQAIAKAVGMEKEVVKWNTLASELRKNYDSRITERDEARKQVVQLTKQLIDAGLTPTTEAE